MRTLTSRVLVLVALLLALAGTASAQALTDAQMDTLKAAIAVDPALSAIPNTYPDGAVQLAAALNAETQAFVVWKTSVSRNEVGKTFVASALAAITAGNNDKLANFAAWNDTINPSRADQRQFFDDVFSVAAGASTRTALAALWRRKARRIEQIFATGTGSDAVPATLVFEGTVSAVDAHNARNRP